MKNLYLRVMLMAAGAAVAGLLLAQSDGTDDGSDLEWEMFGLRIVAGDFSSDSSALMPGEIPVFEGTSFLYNRRTGEVYRVFLNCGEQLGVNGCMEKLPVVREGNFPAVSYQGISTNQRRR